MSDTQDWPEAMATVLECRYDAGAGRAMAFGLPRSEHFLIRFNFWAGGELVEAQMHAPAAMPQGTLFPVRYDPESPHDVRPSL